MTRTNIARLGTVENTVALGSFPHKNRLIGHKCVDMEVSFQPEIRKARSSFQPLCGLVYLYE